MKHPAIQIGKHGRGKGLSLTEAELYDERNASTTLHESSENRAYLENLDHDTADQGREGTVTKSLISANETSYQRHLPKEVLRLYAVKDRSVLGAVTHGYDSRQASESHVGYLPSPVETPSPALVPEISNGLRHEDELARTPPKDAENELSVRKPSGPQRQLVTPTNQLHALHRAGAWLENGLLLYLPSVAAHTHAIHPPSVLYAKKKRGRPRKVRYTIDTPQIIAPPSVQLRTAKLQERPVTKGRPKTFRPYFPSISAHTIPFTCLTKDMRDQLNPQLQLLREMSRNTFSTSGESQSPEKSQRARRKSQKVLESEETGFTSQTPIVKRYTKRSNQSSKPEKPAEQEQLGDLEQPEDSTELDKPNSASNSTRKTETSSHHLKSFTEQEDKIGSRDTAGVYVGEQGKLSMGIGRPRMTRLAIFKSPRLSEFEWFKKEEPRDPSTFTTPRSAAQKRANLIKEGLIEPERGLDLTSGDEPAMTYEQQANQVEKTSSGAYVSKPASIYRELNGGFHRFRSRLLIFKSPRLLELEFFSSKTVVAEEPSLLIDTSMVSPKDPEDFPKTNESSHEADRSITMDVEGMVGTTNPRHPTYHLKMSMKPLGPSKHSSGLLKRATKAKKPGKSPASPDLSQNSPGLPNQTQAPPAAAPSPLNTPSMLLGVRPAFPRTLLGLQPRVYRSPYADTPAPDSQSSTTARFAPSTPAGHTPSISGGNMLSVSTGYTPDMLRYIPSSQGHASYVPQTYPSYAPSGYSPSTPPEFMPYVPLGNRVSNIPDPRALYSEPPGGYLVEQYQHSGYPVPLYQQPNYPHSRYVGPPFGGQSHEFMLSQISGQKRKDAPTTESDWQPPSKRLSTSFHVDESPSLLGHEETRMLRSESGYKDMMAVDWTREPRGNSQDIASMRPGSAQQVSATVYAQAPREIVNGHFGNARLQTTHTSLRTGHPEPQQPSGEGFGELSWAASNGFPISKPSLDPTLAAAVSTNQGDLVHGSQPKPALVIGSSLLERNRQVTVSSEEPDESLDQQQPMVDFSAQAELADPVTLNEDGETFSPGLSSASLPAAPQKPTKKAAAKKPSSKGDVPALSKKQIVMEIIEKCGGVFPGDNELWYAFTTRWLAQDGNTSKPDVRVINGIRKALVDGGKLRRVTFTFENKRGVTVTKSIVTTVDIPPHDPKVEDLVRKLKECDAQYYFPPGTEILEGLKLGKDSVAPRPTPMPPLEPFPAADSLMSSSPPPRSSPPSVAKRGSSRPKKTADENAQLRRTATVRSAEKRFFDVEDDFEEPSFASRRSLTRRNRQGSRGAGRTAPSSPRRSIQPTPGGLFGILKTPTANQKNTTLRNSNLDPEPLDDFDGSFDESAQQLHREAALGQDSHEEQELREQQAFEEHQALFAKRNRRGEGTRYKKQSTLEGSRDGRPMTDAPQPTLRVKFVNPLDPESDSEFEPEIHVPSNAAPRNLRSRVPVQQTTKLKNRSPATYDGYWWKQISTLTDPDQIFHAPTGTFSTNYSVWRDTRLYLRVAPDPGNVLELKPRPRLRLAKAENIDGVYAELRRIADSLRGLDPYDIFVKEVESIEKWETKYAPQDTGKHNNWTFVNHQLLGPQTVASTCSSKIRFDDDEEDGFEPDDEEFEPEEEDPAEDDIGAEDITSDYEVPQPVLGKRKRKSPQKRISRLTRLQEQLTKSSAPAVLEKSLTQGGDARQTKEIKLRGPRSQPTLDEVVEKRIMWAVIITRILTGGMERNIDWRLLTKIFKGQHTESFIHKKWVYMLQKYRVQMTTMTENFQDMFIEAYEKEEVPMIDYDNIEDYDWNALIDWTLENFDTPREQLPGLPPDRATLEARYELRDEWDVRDVSDVYELKNPKPATRRKEVWSKNPYFISIKSSKDHHQNTLYFPTDIEIAQSWIRSNTVTSESSYSQKAAAARLSRFSDKVVDDALQVLLNNKIISQTNKGRLMPSRNFDISASFTNCLSKHLSVAVFREAASFKPHLDKLFQEQGTADFSYYAGDGITMAVLNMFSSHRLKLTPKDPPMSVYGLLSAGKYQTRTVDSSALIFTVSMTPTSTYIYGNPLFPLPTPPKYHPLDAREGSDPEMARSPIWYDINSDLVPLMWNVVLAAVLSIISMRPGLFPSGMRKALGEKIEVWEIEMVYAWLVEAGVARFIGGEGKGKQREGQIGRGSEGDADRGITLGEWWWLCLNDGEWKEA